MKISVDLRGFDLFEDSDSDSDGEEESSGGPGRVQTAGGTTKKSISDAANAEFKKAQRMYLQENEDDDLKGFHLFDEYNDDDSEHVIKLHEMEQGQLAALVRSLLVENAILKDASSRARVKLDSRKEMLKALEANKREMVKVMANEMNNMRDIIRSLATGSGGGTRR